MKKLTAAAALLAASSSIATAGGLDRSGQSVLAVFAEDRTAALSFGVVVPSVTGSDAAGNDYSVGKTYVQGSFSFTRKISDAFSYAFIVDHPYGADVQYGNDPTTSTLGGTAADLNSIAASFIGKYQIGNRFSVFGGVKVERIDADVALNGTAYAQAISLGAVAGQFSAGLPAGAPALTSTQLGTALAAAAAGVTAPAVAIDTTYMTPGLTSTLGTQVSGAVTNYFATGGYNFDMGDTTKVGYVLGAAYEIPDIALRLAATYHFETDHSAKTVETLYGQTFTGDVEFVSPQSLNLEFQTGIAPGTLLTAGYRWTEFSAVDIIPTRLGSDLVNLEDSHRYTVGVARRFSDKFAGSVTLAYEPSNNSDTVSPLGPTDGQFGISLGGQFTDGPLKISGGLNYTKLGDADAGVGGRSVAEFSNSSAVGVGFKLEMTF